MTLADLAARDPRAWLAVKWAAGLLLGSLVVGSVLVWAAYLVFRQMWIGK